MPAYKISSFGGAFQGVSPHLLPNESAQVAENCQILDGALVPFNGNTTVNTPTKSGVIDSIYYWAGTHWFHWATDVDVIRSPVGGNTTDRVIFTGDTEPRITDNSIATTGGTDYPENYYKLGIPAPTTAPTAVLGVGGGCDAEDQINVSYAYSYVSAWGEEGALSDPSTSVSRCPGQTVDLSNLAVAPTGNYNITQKRIYRTYNGEYYLVATLPIATTTYADVIADSALVTLNISADWETPPDDLSGINLLPNGIAVGFSGNQLIPSFPYQPHAYPTSLRQSVDYDIVGLGVFGQNVLVCTEGNPYIATGVSASGMSLDKLELDQACVSKRSITSVGANGAVYASPDGLVMVSMSGVQIVTEQLFTREQWQALNPSSIIGRAHEGRYYGFYDTGAVQKGFVIDLRDPAKGFIDLDLDVTAGYQDLLTDDLYLMIGSNIVRFNDDNGSPLTYTWKSKTFRSATLHNMAVAQVFADSYTDVTFKLYADGVLKSTVTPTNSDPFYLPSGYLARDWEIQLEGTDIVREVAFGTSTAALKEI